MPDAASGIPGRLSRIDGQSFAGYRVAVADARESNSYLCNETHYRALQALSRSESPQTGLRQVYFVHIPYARDGDYAKLAAGVGGVIRALVAE